MSVRNEVPHGQTPASRVGAVISEYAGYGQREQRRLDDKRVRAYIALRLSASVKELLRFRSEQGDKMNGASDDYELSLRRLRNAIDSVTDVPVGYSTFFDAQALPAGEARRIVEADLELIERAQRLVQFVGQLTQLPAEDGVFRDECGALCQTVTEFARSLEERAALFAS
jgi:hypothetical protein